jgi:hypothetical protein
VPANGRFNSAFKGLNFEKQIVILCFEALIQMNHGALYVWEGVPLNGELLC